MSEGKGGVGTRTLNINGVELEVFYCSFLYPTETAAKNAWERAEKKKRKDDEFSVFRTTPYESDEWMVTAIAESLPQARRARRLIVQGGQPFDPDDELLRQLVLRRARVITSAPGPVVQKGRYGKGGIIDDAGNIHPLKRPQG